MTALLVVSADDLGLTDGVCRAVLRAHLDGIVTATSLLAVGRSFELARRMLRDTPAWTWARIWPWSVRTRRC